MAEQKAREAAARKKTRPSKRKGGADDDDEDRPRIAYWKVGVIGIGSIFLVLYGGSYFWEYVEIARAQIPLTATGVCHEFAKNREEAASRYAGSTFAVSGRIKIVRGAKGPKVLFDVPESVGCSMECQFPSRDILKKLPPDAELTIEGECYPRDLNGKPHIVLSDCIVKKGL
jgi:hypothetical protein